MSVDLQLSPDHDLALDLLGRTSLVDGAERVAQQIKVTLLAFLGEWFLDTSFGVPYFDQVLVKNPDRAAIEAVFRARILDVPGVSRVRRLSLAIDRARRVLSVEFEADSAYGLARGTAEFSAP
ncbi:hypothetical protein LMG26696_03367 [Achromobacter pulmonis]|uniref:hypothetical protein n=1 Tax=Achromobacter pulmonis TaxID=1389932 RepID=UPI0014695301|nr:hypothetical protein [Achromobacter pulmonis]CAB3660924.1 hypothetical protein LMG26696_03367 [Achromobacter pulmonis]